MAKKMSNDSSKIVPGSRENYKEVDRVNKEFEARVALKKKYQDAERRAKTEYKNEQLKKSTAALDAEAKRLNRAIGINPDKNVKSNAKKEAVKRLFTGKGKLRGFAGPSWLRSMNK